MPQQSDQHSYAGEPLEEVPAKAAGVRFDERGLVPAVVQQAGTGEVLMVAWMSAESLALTLSTGTTWFWSAQPRRALEQGGHERQRAAGPPRPG